MSFSVGAGGGISGANDVALDNPTNNDAFTYDSTTQKWRNTTLTKTSVGLSNVNDTSDTAKPISTATQAALNAKASIQQSPPWLFASSATTLPPRASVVPAGYVGPIVVCTVSYADFPDDVALSVMQDGDILLSRNSS